MKKITVLLFVLTLLLSGCVYIDGDLLGDLLPEHNTSSHPQIGNVMELRDYIISQRKQGNLKCSFVYSGFEEVDPGVVAQMADVCYVKMIQEGNTYHLDMTEFPGERIVKAHRSGDTQSLSEDEKEVLRLALEMVYDAQSKAADNWELELLLHDMLAVRITYSDADIYYDKPEDQPRHLSVIGALLDGEANCQGYTDAFYTLGSLAGFEVERLSVETDTAPHMANIITIDGQSYIVDLTYNDSCDDAVSYRLFNAGLDMIAMSYTWSEDTESRSIAQSSDENSYYIRNEAAFCDINELAEYIAEKWSENGETEIYVMLYNESDSGKLNDVLPKVLEKQQKSYSYNLWHDSNGIDSFYTIVFNGG